MSANDVNENGPNKTRRAFLLLLPLGLCAGAFTTISAAAFRFLRPRIALATNQWIDVAPISEISGNVPLPKKIATERVSGWATTTEERNVFVLPAKNNQVLSAICPHEGCEVAWDKETNRFSCPCHESFFAADGSRLSGPARRGLDLLPSRQQDGRLQVQTIDHNAKA
ncbi:MAG TPA: Rieske (2Fe-2S) protein [Pyrinomonadaceae bacterium]|nr:Rieske (2Fe-2S) protein [Pyrinomonadaceae bacterium]